jgi:hypothetical protein
VTYTPVENIAACSMIVTRSQSFACSQAVRHAAICSGISPRLRQYSDKSASFSVAVSNTAANLSCKSNLQAQRPHPAKAVPCRAHGYATRATSPLKFLLPSTNVEWPRCLAAASASEQPLFVPVSIPCHLPIPPT